MACNGLKIGSFHLFRHPKRSRLIFWKTTFLTHFGPIFCRKTPHFQGILGFWGSQDGQPRAQNVPKTHVLAFHVAEDHF